MPADGQASAFATTIEAKLHVPGVSGFEVIEARITEGLSARTTAVVEIGSHEDHDLRSALLTGCKLSIERRAANGPAFATREWTLKLSEARFVEHTDSTFRYRLELHDSLWPLGLAVSTRKFRNMSASDIVSKVLGESKIEHEWRLSSDLPVRKYTTQYRETHLAFVERLLAFEGVFYGFDETGKVVFGDTSVAAERLRGGDAYELIEASDGMVRGDVGLHMLRRGKRVTTGKITLGDFNWKVPDVPLSETAEGEADNFIERYEYPASFRKPEQGQRLARLRVEAYRSRAAYLKGKGNDPDFAPGFGFAVGGVAAATFAGEFLLVSLEHGVKNGGFGDGRDGESEPSHYENRFEAIPIDQPYRPLAPQPRPTVKGVHTAMVRGPAGEEIHTDKYGRFRAQLHWDREAVGTDDDSRWMRYLQETASSMTLARTGWEVMVGYIDGDPDRPIGLGRKINGHMTPTYGQPSNKTMMSMKTPSSPSTGGFSEIKMDDLAGAQHISVQAEKDLDALIKNDKSETVGLDETHTVTNDFKRHVVGNQSITIGANDTASYEATSELKVKGNRVVSVGASESVDIGGGQHQTVTKNDSEKVGAIRINIVGSLKKPDFKAMAKSALEGLNPIAALKGGLKNPFKNLLPDVEKKVKALPDTLLEKVTKLPDTLKADVVKALKDKGEHVLDDAYKAAKASFKEKGLGGALDAGWKSLVGEGETALKGLPGTVEKTVESTVKSTIDGMKGDVTGLVKYVEGLPQQVQKTAADYVKTLLPNFGQKMPDKMEGAGGILPSIDQLKSMYSVESLKAGLTSKLDGALNTATGGLYDSFFPKGQNDQRAFKMGWDQVDKLIDMFTTGGISKTAEKSLKVLVGGVTVKASVGKMTWGSKIAWTETIGGVKFTKTPLDIDQKVEGKMQVTVLGQVKRGADKEIAIRSDGTTKIEVGQKTTFEIAETIEVNGKTQVVIEAKGSELLIEGASASIKLTPTSATLKGAKLGVNASAGLTLKGNILTVTKS